MNSILYITAFANRKIELYVEAVRKINPNLECSGFGMIKFIDNIAVVTDVFTIKQNNSQATTDMDQDSLDTMVYTITKDGGNVGDIRLWWHSHGSIDSFWSETDNETIRNFATKGFENCWMFSMVTNNNFEVKTRFDLLYPISIFNYKMDMKVVYTIPDEEKIIEDIAKEVDENIKIVPQIDVPLQAKYDHYDYYYNDDDYDKYMFSNATPVVDSPLLPVPTANQKKKICIRGNVKKVERKI